MSTRRTVVMALGMTRLWTSAPALVRPQASRVQGDASGQAGAGGTAGEKMAEHDQDAKDDQDEEIDGKADTGREKSPRRDGH